MTILVTATVDFTLYAVVLVLFFQYTFVVPPALSVLGVVGVPWFWYVSLFHAHDTANFCHVRSLVILCSSNNESLHLLAVISSFVVICLQDSLLSNHCWSYQNISCLCEELIVYVELKKDEQYTLPLYFCYTSLWDKPYFWGMLDVH